MDRKHDSEIRTTTEVSYALMSRYGSQLFPRLWKRNLKFHNEAFRLVC